MTKTFTRALRAGAAALVLGCGAQAASAAALSFDFTTGATGGLVTGKTFTATNAPGLQVSVTAWHASDIAFVPDYDSISSASLGLYDQGLGVTGAGDHSITNDHEIDNQDGVDFLMLRFNQDVSLSGITRYVFPLGGVSPTDSDAAYWADTAHTLGTAATWKTTPDLTTTRSNNSYVQESLWDQLAGPAGSGQSSTGFTSGKVASTWLVGADFADRNDGFKLKAIQVTTASVPEPATWGMMILGFGAIGSAMRRSRRAGTAAA